MRRWRTFTAVPLLSLAFVAILAMQAWAATPVIESFTNDPPFANAITLHWQTSGGATLYIYGARYNTKNQMKDVGYRPLNGDITFLAPRGRNRYTLVVTSADTPPATVAKRIDVVVNGPAPVPVTSPNPRYIDVFTSTNPPQGALEDVSTIGYINLTSWTPGAYYTGMPAALVDPARRNIAVASYAGIGIHPTTGVIALADSDRRQLVRLQPNAP
jgi:hypothetical protein